MARKKFNPHKNYNPNEISGTLKDFILNEGFIPEEVCVVSVKDLRNGAKQWIKFIKSHMGKFDKMYHQGQIDWINVFFNLEKSRRKKK